MECKNCGASIGPQDRRCPYCGADNYQASMKEHRDIVDGYNRKAYFWRTLPERLSRKGIKLSVLFLILVIAIGLIGIVIAQIVGRVGANYEYKKEQKDIAALEEMYSNQEFREVAAYIKEHDIYYSESFFDKYDETEHMDFYYDLGSRNFEENCVNAKKFHESLYFQDLQYLFQCLDLCDIYEKNDSLQQGEEARTFYRGKVKELLQDELMLTEEDISDLMALYRQKNGGSWDQAEPYEQVMAQYIYENYMAHESE